jgi:hypothetical protein
MMSLMLKTLVFTSASYLDILLKLHANNKLKTQLYDKMDYLNCSIVNNQFHLYVDSVYPIDEVEIKYTTGCSIFPLYLDMLLKLDADGKLTTQFYNNKIISIATSSTSLAHVAT